MIAKDSKSYPYLAIAQHHGIDYSEVLKYANMIKVKIHTRMPTIHYSEWKLEVWFLEIAHAKTQ